MTLTEKREILDNYKLLSKNGNIGDCLLRRVAEESVSNGTPILLQMNIVASNVAFELAYEYLSLSNNEGIKQNFQTKDGRYFLNFKEAQEHKTNLEREEQKKLEESSKIISKKKEKKKVVIIGDFGKDLDDELSLVFASAFKEDINLLGVISNLYPSDLRANIAQSTLNELLMFDTTVSIGENICSNIKLHDYESEIPYLKNYNIQLQGFDYLKEILLDNKVHIVLQSGLTDFANFYKENINLVYNKVESVTIMGGILLDENGQPQLDERKCVIPDTAANNNFDIESAKWLYQTLQLEEVPLNISTRYMAYACPIEKQFYEDISFSNIGMALLQRQSKALIELYKETKNSSESRTLPARCTEEWFLNTFTDVKSFVGPDEEVFSICSKINIYDPLNLMILVSEFEEAYLNGIVLSNRPTVKIYGISELENGFKNPIGAKSFFSEKIISNLKEIEFLKNTNLEQFIKFQLETYSEKEKEIVQTYILDFLSNESDLEKFTKLYQLQTSYTNLFNKYNKLDDKERAWTYNNLSIKLKYYILFFEKIINK